MARLPDATDLGERVVAQRRVPIADNAGPQIEHEALGNAADQIHQRARQFQAHDDQFNYARAKSYVQTKDAELRKEFETDADWQTQESRYNEKMKVAREEAGMMIHGGRSRAMFDIDAKQDVDRGTEQIRGNAHKVEGEWARGALDTTLESNRRAALETKDQASRAALIQSTADSIRGALDKQYITPEQAVQVEQAWKSSYGEGFVNVQKPGEQMRLLKNPKGTPADFIDPSKRADLLERLEDKQRVAVDRREARAERVAAQAERQISSGVPATAEMWNEWRSTVAGTSVEKDFNALVAGEKEVQDTLRKPVGEQIRLAQEKQAALMKNGGTLAEAANVSRLTNAVKQNVALLKDSPLLFAEQRLDEPSVPLDLAALTDPAKKVETAAVFQERAAQIRTLSKHFGASVPMKPLLQQESDQLKAVLENASPAQSAETFAALRDSAGSMDVFRGMMAQVAPDAPVKAMAGLLAAQQRELVGESHWFSPDLRSLGSRDVSATMLRGEALLNPSKSEKGNDGKPQTKQLLLPEAAQKGLQDAFVNSVGNAFAYRAPAATNAFQAVQAYYVGRADELGQLSRDTQTVDTNLVREAIRATQGNVVDYNGNGHVLVPWGMAADDFDDRVTRAFAAETKRRGLKGDVTPETSTFGLANADEDGLYGITIGKDHNLLLDKSGEAVTINLKPSDLRDAAGTIQR